MQPRFAFMSEASPGAVTEFLLSAGLSREIIEWKYFDARMNRTQDERGVVIVRGDEVVGLLGFTRFAYGNGGARWTGHWIYDWAKNERAGRGAGRRLVLECAERCGVIIGVGGTAITRHIFPSIARIMAPGAYVGLQRPLRLGFAMDRIHGRLRGRVPAGLGRLAPDGLMDALSQVPVARRPGRASAALRAAIRTEPGVSRAIEPLLEVRPAHPGSMVPLHDFEYVDWQLGRCPAIETATTYIGGPGARAAVLHWRSSPLMGAAPGDAIGAASAAPGASDGRYWRIALLCQPGAEAELAALVDHVLGLAYQRGAMAVGAVASRHDRGTIDLLGARGFLLGRSRLPMWLFRGESEAAPLVELEGTSYLDADLAYRF